jgi:hypothetical protein
MYFVIARAARFGVNKTSAAPDPLRPPALAPARLESL